MPRHYKRSTRTVYSQTELQTQIDLYRSLLGSSSEISMLQACKLDQNREIPHETFRRHLKDKNCHFGPGRPTVLTKAEKEYLVFGLQCLADYGWGVGPDDLQEIIANFVNFVRRENPFKDNIPGLDWIHDFCERWKEKISLRKPEYLTSARANAITEENHEKFMELFENLQNRLGIKDNREQQYNCDEIGMAMDPKVHKIFTRRGEKSVSIVVPTEGKERVTVLVCGNAAGDYLPPFSVDCE